MLATHIFDVPEIDTQHEVIFAQLEALQAAGSDEERRDGLERLRELLVAHFRTEESFMEAHVQKHRDMLNLLDDCLSPATPMTEGIGRLAGSLRSHEFRNPDIAW